MPGYNDATIAQVNEIMQAAATAAIAFRKVPPPRRAAFMKSVADGLENSGDELLHITMAETNLPEARLRGERMRTVFQLRSYADACARGDWQEIRIDTAIPDKVPPKPDIRKMLVPLGPVVVFGSSNFPYAYSTAGGDTASALAAGCPVVVKAHPAHPETSERVAQIILQAAAATNMPANVFAHVHGAAFEVGQALVLHPQTKAVGFTGSYAGGKALFDLANTRREPIPVFAEMGSVNPVYLLPEKLANDAAGIAAQYAGSITLGVGQFCTNPGLIIGVRSEGLSRFVQVLAEEIGKIPAAHMLHGGILKSYVSKRADALAQQGVTLVAKGLEGKSDDQAVATIATVDAAVFLSNPLLHQEVFGPYSLIIQCEDESQMLEVARHMEGQLTNTLMATDKDVISNIALLDAVGEKCGRLILNGVPTGVEVCPSMHHGGPFPATTDSRFTSVGVDAIKRFARPLSLQNWPDHFLPTELQDANLAGLLRMVNGVMTTEAVIR